MKRFGAVVGLVIFVLVAMMNLQASEEILTNQDVMDMIKAGLSSELVAKKISSGDGIFEMSPQSMIDLKKAGVPDPLIEMMLKESIKTQKKIRAKMMVEIQNLASDNPEVSRKAYFYLKRLNQAAFPQLRDALGDINPAIRASAAKTLGEFGDKNSATLLRELIHDKDEGVRLNAAEALALLQDEAGLMIARKAVSSGVNPLDGYIKLLGLRKDLEYAGFIGMRLLKNPDAKTRAMAAWALGEICTERALIPLEDALINDRDIEVKKAAALAIGKLHKESSFTKLANIGSDFPKVRKEVLIAIGQYPAEKSVPFLIAVMSQTFDADQKKVIRDALRKHTSRDFGDDMQKWKQWLNDNKDKLSKE